MVGFVDETGGGETEEERKKRLWAAILEADAARARQAAAGGDRPEGVGSTARLELPPARRAPPPDVAPEGVGSTARLPAPAVRAPRDTPGLVPAPDEAPVIDYEDDPFIPVPEEAVPDFEEEPFTREDLLGAFPEEFLDTEGEQPLAADFEPEPFLPDDTSFELPPPPDDLVLPDVEEILSAPPVPEDYFLDVEAEGQPGAPDVSALTDGVSFLTLADEERRRRTEEARLEGLDLLAGFEPDSLRAEGARGREPSAERFGQYLPDDEAVAFGAEGIPGVQRGTGVSVPYDSRALEGGEADLDQQRRFINWLSPADVERWNNRGRSAEDQQFIGRLWNQFLAADAESQAGILATREGLGAAPPEGRYRPDFLYLPEGTNEAETDIFDFRIREGPTTATSPNGLAEPLPLGAEFGGLLPGGQELGTSTPGPELTVDRLAQLPDLSQFGFAELPELPGLAALQPGAQELAGVRDAAPVTPESLRAEIIQALPDTDPAQIDAYLATPQGTALLTEQQQAREQGRQLAQSAIDDVNRGLAIDEARNRAIARLNQRQAQPADGTPRTIEGAGARGEAISGRVKGGVFIPDRSLLPEEANRVLDADPNLLHVERGGAATPVNPLAPVQAAIKAAADSPLGPVLQPVRWAWDNVGGTLLDKSLDVLGYADDRMKELTVLGVEGGLLEAIAEFSGGGPISGRAGLGQALVPEGTTELRQELRQMPMSEKKQLAPAIRSVVMTGNLDNLARDLNEGMNPKDAAQKYQNFWVELAGAVVLDPFNAVIPAVNTVRMARGLQTASGAIQLEERINARALRAMDAVSDAEAVAPWDQMRRIGDVRALRSSDPFAVLGTRGVTARASSAREMADEVTTLFELRIARQAGGSVDELEPIIRSLATQGGDATARQYFNGIAATRAHQNARLVAPELTSALDTPSSALRQALDKEVWQGTDEAWRALKPSERPRGVYANEREKMANVLGAVQETSNRSARVKFGLDPETDTRIARAQSAMRGVLSNVYLFNPRYYIRNAIGDQVTALERGFSAWARPADMRAYWNEIGRVRTKARAGEFGTLDESRIPVFGPVRARLGDTEAGRWDTTYFHAHRRGWGGRRASAYEDGRENIAGFLDRRTDIARYARAEIENARTVADLQRLKATPGAAPGFKLSGRTVLDDLDDGDIQPVLRWRLDRIAQRAGSIGSDGARTRYVDGEIAKLLDDAATHATASTSHLGDLQMRADDWRQLKAEVDALKANGIPHQQAVTQALSSFGEGRHTNARIAQQWLEVEERLTGKFGRQFGQEQRALQAKHRDLRDGWTRERGRLRDEALATAPAERGAAWQRYYAYTTQQRQTINQTVIGDLDGLVVKMRTAQNGTGFGGPKAAAQYRTVDDMTAALEQRLTHLKSGEAMAERVRGVNVGSILRRGQPDPRAIQSRADAIRDTEEALANLRGAGRIEQVANPMRGTAAVGASTQSAKDALYVLQFEDRLPAAVQDFRTARPVVKDLTPLERRGWNTYIDRQIQRFGQDRVAADAMARGQANWILHNYDRTYDYDFWLRWVSPWELWTSRTMAKLPLRVADNPQYFSKVDLFRDQMEAANSDLPEWLQQKVKIPMPFLPDWMADSTYVDPVKLALPLDLLDSFVAQSEEDRAVGKARATMNFVGMTPGPIADTLLALVPGGQNFWETQARSPLADVYTAVAAVANMAGAPVPYRPVNTMAMLKDGRRQLALMRAGGELTEQQWLDASRDLEQHTTLGAALKGSPLENEHARTALQRSQGRVGARSWMSLFGILGASFETEGEQRLVELTKEYGRLREAGDTPGADAYLEQHPELTAWWNLGVTPAERVKALGTTEFYNEMERISQQSRERLAGLPLFGTDLDRQKEYDRRDLEQRDATEGIKGKYPGFTPPSPRAPSLVEDIARTIQGMEAPRDSNGVKDTGTWLVRREEALQSFVRPPVTDPESGQILTEFAPPVSREQIIAALLPSTVDGAAKQMVETVIREGWDGREQAGKDAKTREDKQKAEQAYEAAWAMPDREALADRVLREFPNRFTREAVLAALDTSVPQTLQQASTVSEAERLTKFRASLNDQGVSDEPFYGNQAAGVVIRTQADLDRHQKGRNDDREYDQRKAANDPTYRLYDTDDRAWVSGGEPVVALGRLERAIMEQALGPMTEAGGRDGTKAKGWNSTFTFPNGEKARTYDALQQVNKATSEYYTGIYGESLPSEKDGEAKEQTADSNASARGTSRAGGTPRRGTSRSTSRGTSSRSSSRTTSYRSSSYRAPAGDGLGPSPSVPALKWINDGVLTRTRLTGVDAAGALAVNLRDEWRKGTGLTPEKWTAFLAKHPGVDAAISQAEGLHAGIAADPNGVTSAIHEQALVVQTALEEARATDAERKAGIQVSGLTNITEQLVSSKSIRKGTADLARAFRTGTAGLGTEQKWSEFLASHPDLGAAITQAQAQVDALKTDDEAPDDLTELTAVYETMRQIGDQITELRTLDRTAETERLTALREAGTQLREEQRDEMRTFQAGAVVPSIDKINDAWLQPARLRRGGTDFDRAFRLGSGLADVAAWTAFLERNPQVKSAIDSLNQGAKQFVTKAVAPRDAEAMTGFYDGVATVAAQITAAQEAERQAEADAEYEARGARQAAIRQRTTGGTGGGGGDGVGFFESRAAARKKKRREEEEE